ESVISRNQLICPMARLFIKTLGLRGWKDVTWLVTRGTDNFEQIKAML
ncbi:MAG: hypothetical protein ACI8W9_001202, partial [Psychromonas sp.]